MEEYFILCVSVPCPNGRVVVTATKASIITYGHILTYLKQNLLKANATVQWQPSNRGAGVEGKSNGTSSWVTMQRDVLVDSPCQWFYVCSLTVPSLLYEERCLTGCESPLEIQLILWGKFNAWVKHGIGFHWHLDLKVHCKVESALLFAYADEEIKAQRGEFTSQGHLSKAVVVFGYKILSPHSVSVFPIIFLYQSCPSLSSSIRFMCFSSCGLKKPTKFSLPWLFTWEKLYLAFIQDTWTSIKFSLVLIEQRRNISTVYLGMLVYLLISWAQGMCAYLLWAGAAYWFEVSHLC